MYQTFRLDYYWPLFDIIPEKLLFVCYIVDFLTKFYLNKVRFSLARKLRLTKNPFGEGDLYGSSPYIDRYFKWRGTP